MRISKQELRQILEDEIKRHTIGMRMHKELADKTGSKKQREKQTKHMHKRFQTIHLAKMIGFEICFECWRLK